MTEFVFFCATSSPLSQWHPSSFTAPSTVCPTMGHQRFNTAEQRMMAEKALLFNDMETYQKILISSNPKKQKEFGRQVKNYDDLVWAQWREQIVYDSNYHKFSQNESLKQYLLDTGDKWLVEAAHYDKVWGIGLRATHPDATKPEKWPGLNLLGKILMQVREQLNKE